MWLGQQGRRGEVRRGEAWDGSLMRAGGGTAVDGVRGKRKRMTHCAQMTPREIKKRGGDYAAKPALSPVACLYCMYRRGDGMQARRGISAVMERWHRRISTNFKEIIYTEKTGCFC